MRRAAHHPEHYNWPGNALSRSPRFYANFKITTDQSLSLSYAHLYFVILAHVRKANVKINKLSKALLQKIIHYCARRACCFYFARVPGPTRATRLSSFGVGECERSEREISKLSNCCLRPTIIQQCQAKW